MEYISVVFLTIFFSSGTNTQKKKTSSGCELSTPWDNSQNDMGGETDRFLIARNLLMTLSLWPKICTPVGKKQASIFYDPSAQSTFPLTLSLSILSAHQLFTVIKDAKRFSCNIHTMRSNHEKAC